VLYAAVLALTVALEAPIYLALLRPRPSWWRAVACVVGVNVVIQPVVWLALGRADDGYWAGFAAAAVGAWLIEAALLRLAWTGRAAPRLAPVTLLANAVSCVAGLLLTA
jgi:hypothetical protein